MDSYRDQQGNKFGPERVWLKDQDLPGLAMSRSFGDVVACTVSGGNSCSNKCKDNDRTCRESGRRNVVGKGRKSVGKVIGKI